MLEFFNSTELNEDESSVYDQAQVASGFGFLRYPSPFPEQGVPKQEDSSTNTKSIPNSRSVHRLTRLFDITNNSQNKPIGPFSEHKFRDIMRRLVHEDKSPMDLAEVLDFFEGHVHNITARYQELRSPAVSVPSEHVPLPTADLHPKVMISSVNEHLPWSTILSGLEFDGHGGVTHDRRNVQAPSAQLQWRTNFAGSSSENGNVKRNSQSGPSGHIKHEIAGTLRSLQAINVLDSASGDGKAKRATRPWKIEKRQDKYGDVFRADVSGHYFENDIKYQKCGTDNYTGDTKKNKRACEAFVSNVINRITMRMTAAYTAANHDSPIAMASYLQDKFATYSTWRNADKIHIPAVKAKVKSNLQNGLVSKAYADGNCFVRCGTARGYKVNFGPSVDIDKDVSCQTGCYDHIKNTYERLYGFEDSWSLGEGNATKEPWNLDEKRIIKVAGNAYKNRKRYNFYPGTVNLNPYTPLTQDMSPILPVCYSELGYQHHLICSCGNRYGDMTSQFAQAVNLRAVGKKNEWKAIDSCLNQIKPLAYDSPAAYLLNACNVIYKIAAPKGTGSAQEKDDLGHYKHNYKACARYWTYYNANKHQSDAELNRALCNLWGQHAKDFDRGTNHNHPDFSYVNDMLEDHGCKDFH